MKAHIPTLKELQALAWACQVYYQWCSYANFALELYGSGITKIKLEINTDFDSDLGEYYSIGQVWAYYGNVMRWPDPDCLLKAGFKSDNSPDSIGFGIELQEFISDLAANLPLPTAFCNLCEQDTIVIHLNKLPVGAQLALRIRLEDK